VAFSLRKTPLILPLASEYLERSLRANGTYSVLRPNPSLGRIFPDLGSSNVVFAVREILRGGGLYRPNDSKLPMWPRTELSTVFVICSFFQLSAPAGESPQARIEDSARLHR
jgi:hypothetical protein